LTRTDDGQHRAAYARYTEYRPRRAVFIGTSNDDSALPNDPTGNRRFVAVPCPGNGTRSRDLVAAVSEQREQLWAEALQWVYSKQLTGRLPSGLKQHQAERNEQHRSANPLIEDAVADVLQKNFLLGYVLASDLQTQVTNQVAPTKTNAKQIAGIAKMQGWESKPRSIDGQIKRVWQPSSDGN